MIDGCAAHGYRAVEADNLDSFTRSQGHLTVANALALAGLLTTRAHHDHLAIGQKNAAELTASPRGRVRLRGRAGVRVYTECDSDTTVCGRHLIEIEYTDEPSAIFIKACMLRGKTVSVVLRDRDVAPTGDPHHVGRVPLAGSM